MLVYTANFFPTLPILHLLFIYISFETDLLLLLLLLNWGVLNLHKIIISIFSTQYHKSSMMNKATTNRNNDLQRVTLYHDSPVDNRLVSNRLHQVH
ncbi:hypothetical protein BDZ91DRAFT_289897 [Kalaharituber pfeilii]|nr:hypothetical protein BDZ91DRAFT_289897 [Kalaharituber pfeilii]